MLLALTPEPLPAATARSAVRDRGRERALYDAIRLGDEAQAAQVYAGLLPAVELTLRRVLGYPYDDLRELSRRSLEAIIVELSEHPTPHVCRLEAWATTIAARVALQALSEHTRRARSGLVWKDAMATAREAASASPGSPIERLRCLLTELPREEAEVIVLCQVMGLDTNEVAVTLGVSLERVGRLLAAAHARLSRLLSGD